MVPLERAAPRLAARGLREGVGHTPLGQCRGRSAGDGRPGTAADSDPERAGPRRSAAATSSPRARKGAADPAPPPPARPPARSRRPEKGRTATSASGRRRRRRAGATPSAPRGGGGWAARAAERATQTEPPSRPRRPRRVRPSPGSLLGPGGRGGDSRRRRPGVPSLPLCRPPGTLSRTGDRDRGRGRGRGGRYSGGGGPCCAEGGPNRSRCLGRAPSGACPAQPALAAEGAACSAPDWIPSLAQLRVGRLHAGTLPPLAGCPRPLARRPARPSVSLTQAHTPRAGAPLSARTHSAAHASLGFCIRSHARSDTDPFPPHASLAPFPPHFLEESPYGFRTLLACPTPTSSPFPKPPPHLNCPCY